MLRRLVVLSAGLCLSLLVAMPASATSGKVTIFATGLNNPRGLAFGPDGNLYVAEGGTGGTLTTTPAECSQVPAPVGPYSGGLTARISKIGPTGVRTTVVDGLPSSQTQPMPVPLISGVADVAFIGSTLYGLEAGAGCSHGLAGTYNDVFRVNGDGTVTPIANLSNFVMTHPVAHPNADDFEPDGTWYSMVAVRGAFYAVEPNHGEVDRIRTTGSISRLADISATQGHIVPTTIAYHGNFFLGNLDLFPVTPADAKILKLTPSGEVMTWATGLQAVLGVAFDHEGRLYALENTTCATPCFPTPFTGKVVRLNGDGSWTTIASGLLFPTAMTFGPDGDIYVSTLGFGGPPGAGMVERIAIAG